MSFKIIPCFIFGIAFFINFSYAGELISKEAVNYYNEGVDAQKSGNLDAAGFAYHKSMLLDPNPEYLKFILNNFGILEANGGNLETAEEIFGRCLSMDQKYRTTRLNLGLIYDIQPDKLKAIEYWLNLFNLDLDTKKPKGFIIFDVPDFSDKVLISDTKDIESQKFLFNSAGIIHAQKGDLEAAEGKFKEALQLSPKYRAAQLNLGLIYDRQQDKLKAIEYWLKIFAIDLETLKPKSFLIEEAVRKSS